MTIYKGSNVTTDITHGENGNNLAVVGHDLATINSNKLDFSL